RRARRRVLQELLLRRVEVMLDRERRQRRLVESRQDQLLLAGIGVDVTDRENAGYRRLEFLGVDLERFLLELEPPLRDRPQLRMQAEKGEHVVGLESMHGAVARLHLDTTQRGGVGAGAIDDQRMREPLDVTQLPRRL